MKTYRIVEVYLHEFYALDRGEWSASRPGRFNVEVRVAGTHWIGGWMGPRAGLDEVAKKISHYTYRE
jgi:hypothetical protein